MVLVALQCPSILGPLGLRCLAVRFPDFCTTLPFSSYIHNMYINVCTWELIKRSSKDYVHREPFMLLAKFPILEK